ncbi:MAG: hypothetical protein Q8K72_10160, partial [Acidimicrobiales bacterium]|nr:hypothetical protein [Acidimicrobiales bacterium]
MSRDRDRPGMSGARRAHGGPEKMCELAGGRRGRGRRNLRRSYITDEEGGLAQLSKFTLSEMVRTSAALRQLGQDATSVEEFADRVVRYLRIVLVDPITGEPETSLVRFYKTHPYGDLPEDLRAFASGLLEGGSSPSAMKCLTLLGTVGDDPAWGDRLASQGHRAVPLPSEEVVARLPMIAQLISQFGLAVGTVLEPDPE